MNILKIAKKLRESFQEKRLPPLEIRERIFSSWDHDEKRTIYNLFRHVLPLAYYLSSNYPKWEKKKSAQIGFFCIIVGLELKVFGKKPIYFVFDSVLKALKSCNLSWLAPIARAILEQAPTNSDDFWQNFYGIIPESEWLFELCQNNPSIAIENFFSHPPLWIRISSHNPSMVDQLEINQEIIIKREITNGAIQITGTDQTTEQLFKRGAISFQNISSQLLSRILDLIDISPQNILDCCAAPGGKSAIMIEKYPHAEYICLTDISAERLQDLEKNLSRLNLKKQNIQILLKDWSEYQDTPSKELYDLVLIDPPCSGSGVTRKHPDSLWKKQDLDMLTTIQKSILEQVSYSVRENGFIIYSTCSIHSKENQDQISEFLLKNKNWSLHPIEIPYAQKLPIGYSILPSSECDGMYYCILQKNMF